MRSLLLIFLLLLAAASPAGVRESSDNIVDRRTHKFLTALSDRLGFPDTEMGKGQASASVSTAGCNFSVLVVGPVAGDARRYARIIDAWRAKQGFPGDVEWSQEDDSASALYRNRPGKPGLTEAITRLDLPSLREAMLRAEPRTSFAAVDATWSKIDYGFAPDAEAPNGTRYWDFTRDRPGLRPVVASIRLPSWLPVALIAWFGMLPVGLLVCFGLGILVSKQENVSLPDRRKLYSRIVLGGTYGLMAVHGVLAIATLTTRAMEPIAQLWFGQRFTSVAIPALLPMTLVPFLILPLMTRCEKRLFGVSPEEKAARSPALQPVHEVESVPKPRWLRVSSLVMVLGWLLWGGSIFISNKSPYRIPVQLFGMSMALLPGFGDLSKIKKINYKVEPEVIEGFAADLREQVARLSARMGMQPVPSRVLTQAMYGPFGAVADREGVGVSVHALELLDPAEIDYLVAHELAHKKLDHVKKRRMFTLAPSVLILVPAAFLAFGRSLALSTPAFVLSPFLLVLAFTIPYPFLMRRMFRQQEFEADRLAVETTGDPAAAMSCLRKITLNDPSPGIHDTDMSTHPDVSARLNAIRAMAGA